MKTGKIIRRDGSILTFTEVAPFTYRLTLDGKPYNVGDNLMKAVEEGNLKK